MVGNVRVRFGALSTLAVLALTGVPSALPLPTATDHRHATRLTTSPRSVPGELIVGFAPGVSRAEQANAVGRAGGRRKREYARIGAVLASVPAAETERATAALRRNPRVRYVEPNSLVSADDHGGTPDDPSFHELWGLDNFGQAVSGWPGTPDADIDAAEAWAVTTGSAETVVAVIDTGVDFGHPDLGGPSTPNPVMWTNPGETCGGCRNDGRDNDGNGYVDDWKGWDFANGDNDPFDDHGHGTHVAGTIGALGDNAIGVVGVNWRVRLMGLKFLSASGSGTTADAVEAVLYAAAQGAGVTNNSWGGDDFSQALLDAIRVADSADSLFVAAAGNSTADNDVAPHYPSSYDSPNVIAVAATDPNDGRAWFSNTGRRSVDLGAPGVNVYSTWPGGSYQFASGTSMATPHVAGAAALVKAAFPAASDVGLKTLLLRSVDTNSALTGRTSTGGRLNLDRAVRCLGSPKVWIESPADGFSVDVGGEVAVRVIASRCADAAAVTVSAAVNGASVELSARGDGLYEGSFTPAAPGAVTLSATAASGGQTDTRTVSGVAIQVYDIEPGGPPVTVTTSAANENARLAFDGDAGQRVSLGVSSVTIGSSSCCSVKVSMSGPAGETVVAPTSFGTTGAFVDTRTLPSAGRYSILIDPQGPATGSATLTLYDVPADDTADLVPGGPAATLTTTIPGQNARGTFQGVAGRRVSVRVSPLTVGSSTCCSTKVSILRPDGSVLTPTSSMGTSGGFVDALTLPATGPYRVVVDPQGASTGSATLTVYDVPEDASGQTAPGGPAATVSTSVPGQNARATFQGETGRRISLRLTGVTIGSSSCCSAKLSVLRPDGTPLVAATTFGRSGAFVDTRTLPASGSYTILVDPQGADTGSATLTLYDVPTDASAAIVAGGSAATLSIGVPGQNGRATFDGVAGQRISLRISPLTIGTSTCCSTKVSILNPDGSALAAPANMGTAGGYVDTRTLGATGAYAIVVDPQGGDTGSATLTLYDVPGDASAAIAVGGPAVTLSMPVPGQNGRATFDGVAGQRISLRLSSVTVGPSSCCSSKVSISGPDGRVLAGPSLFGTAGATITATPSLSGPHVVQVDPQAAATGSATLTLSPAAAALWSYRRGGR